MNEQQLRERFEEFSAPPTALEVDSLVPALRRRAARRRLVRTGSGVVAAAALVAAGSTLVPGGLGGDGTAPADGAARCAAGTALPAPAGLRDVGATAIDPSGRYVAGNERSATMRTDPETGRMSDVQLTKPVLWTDERPRALPMPAASVWAADVNADGTVAAVGSDGHHWTSVIRYTEGQATTMRTPPGSWIVDPDLHIDDDGDILFNARKAETNEGDIGEVWRWRAGSPAAERVPSVTAAKVAGLTKDGAVVGDHYLASDAVHGSPYVWDAQGKRRALAVPDGRSATVQAVRGDWAVGELTDGGAVQWWNVRTGASGTSDVRGPVAAVNTQGWFVTDRGLHRDDTTVAITAPKGAQVAASGLSDTGVVAGSMLVSDGGDATRPSGALLWRCDG